MRTQLDEKREAIKKIEQLTSADEILRVQAFIAGLEAGQELKGNDKQTS